MVTAAVAGYSRVPAPPARTIPLWIGIGTGSDMPGSDIYHNLGKVIGADIPAEAKQLILAGNAERISRYRLGAKTSAEPMPEREAERLRTDVIAAYAG